MNEREKFIQEANVLADHDDTYIVLAESNQYEIDKVTPERINRDGRSNSGAALLRLEDDTERWIPKSVLAIDTDETLYVQDWYFNKYF